MRRALFLDRDGVINVEKGHYVYRVEDFDFVPGIMEVIKRVKEAGVQVFIVTNQGGIAKGLYDHSNVKNVHDLLKETCKSNGFGIDAIYYCPHHSDIASCLCRKPGSLLFEKIIAKFDIDAGHSLMIGDRQRDVEAANNAGIPGIQIESNQRIDDIVENWLNG